MKFYVGNFAYEVVHEIDLGTQLHTGWRFRIFQIFPYEKLLDESDLLFSARGPCERNARQIVRDLAVLDRMAAAYLKCAG
jgi:hypothetical protein